jgi:hypothetical protein
VLGSELEAARILFRHECICRGNVGTLVWVHPPLGRNYPCIPWPYTGLSPLARESGGCILECNRYSTVGIFLCLRPQHARNRFGMQTFAELYIVPIQRASIQEAAMWLVEVE